MVFFSDVVVLILRSIEIIIIIKTFNTQIEIETETGLSLHKTPRKDICLLSFDFIQFHGHAEEHRVTHGKEKWNEMHLAKQRIVVVGFGLL